MHTRISIITALPGHARTIHKQQLSNPSLLHLTRPQTATMHGRPRDYKHKLRDPKAQEAYKKKVDAIRTGTSLVLECRRQQQYNELVMNGSAKLLKVVPEIYTIWNFRREALTPVFEAGGAEAEKASAGELALTQACLMENPKSYSTWHHRKWVVLKGLADLNQELQLVSRALDEDQRNFHAWNYRQFIVRLMKRPPAEELEYTVEKIVQNFSNYSAWHARTILLPRVHCGQPDEQDEPSTSGAAAGAGGGFVAAQQAGSASQRKALPHEVLDEEYDMVHQAFATDSQDQSPWMYYRWLIGNTLAHLQGDGASDEAARLQVRGVLEREVVRLRQDHLADDPDAKWPLLTLARLLEAQARMGLYDGGTSSGAERGAEGDGRALLDEAKSIYARLMQLDPLRRGYYQDALDGKAFVVVQALGTC